jgi:hypothetical protein
MVKSVRQKAPDNIQTTTGGENVGRCQEAPTVTEGAGEGECTFVRARGQVVAWRRRGRDSPLVVREVDTLGNPKKNGTVKNDIQT